ncbi:MAG: class I SAM-dependent methyltransferase [Planctomycetota bacterium]
MTAAWLRSLRYSTAALLWEQRIKAWRRRRKLRHHAAYAGRCPLCLAKDSLVARGDNPREDIVCARCGSVPRHRAVIQVLHDSTPPVDGLCVHESSPSACTWQWFRDHSGDYTASHWFPGAPNGSRVGAFVAMDLANQGFDDGSFDLVVTLDVLEHVADPHAVIREIHRTLRPGGRHVFTVPRTRGVVTRTRAVLTEDGWQHVLPPTYHVNPIDDEGSLVVTDWGDDLESIYSRDADASIDALSIRSPAIGVPGPLEIFVATQRTES